MLGSGSGKVTWYRNVGEGKEPKGNRGNEGFVMSRFSVIRVYSYYYLAESSQSAQIFSSSFSSSIECLGSITRTTTRTIRLRLRRAEFIRG